MKFTSCCHVDVIVRRDGSKQVSKKNNSKVVVVDVFLNS